jgi:cytidine deaminase
MTNDDIIRMAQDVGAARLHSTGNIIFGVNALEHFVLLVAAAEREACIKLLEDFSQTQMVPVLDTWRMGLIAGANAIRARGNHE